jgi:peptidoglycan/LPS O-acetylase OafA/YrhL
MQASSPRNIRLPWLEPLKALALFGVLCNHLVENFGSGPWFAPPTDHWGPFSNRMHGIFPEGTNLVSIIIRVLGWLGDSTPGIFIFASGLGLVLGRYRNGNTKETVAGFYGKRLLRIFPLYIAMHFLVLGVTALAGGQGIASFASRKTLLSLLGLRFHHSLFFYIVPAWWFVWLIIQCYLAFPLLYRWLEKMGPIPFFLLSVGITLVSRLAGNFFTDSKPIWMTGMFGGTRLDEFAAGMALASWLARRDPETPIPKSSTVLAWAMPIYFAGLLCSRSALGSLVSNCLVTLGLVGLGYWICNSLFPTRGKPARMLTWIGVHSYAIYLLHSLFLAEMDRFVPGADYANWALAILLLAISFPAGWAVSRCVDVLVRHCLRRQWRKPFDPLALFAALAAILGLVVLEPMLRESNRGNLLSAWLFGLSIFILGYAEWASPEGETAGLRIIRRAALLASVLQLWVLPPHFGWATVLLSILPALLLETLSGRFIRG